MSRPIGWCASRPPLPRWRRLEKAEPPPQRNESTPVDCPRGNRFFTATYIGGAYKFARLESGILKVLELQRFSPVTGKL